MNESEKIDYDFLISEVQKISTLDKKRGIITLTQKKYCELKGGYFFLIQELMKREFKLIMQD